MNFATDKNDNLTCEIIFGKFTCDSALCSNAILGVILGVIVGNFLYNKLNNKCLELRWNLFPQCWPKVSNSSGQVRRNFYPITDID